MTKALTFANAKDASAVLTSLHAGGNAIDSGAVASAIKWIASTGKKLDDRIHATAVACIHLSMPQDVGGHLNADSARQLLNAMPRGSRAKALAAWFEAFSNIRLTYDKKAGEWKVKLLKPQDAGYADADPKAAFDKPFWSVDEQDVDAAAFSIGALLKTLLTKADKAATAGTLSPDDMAVVEALKGNAKVKAAIKRTEVKA